MRPSKLEKANLELRYPSLRIPYPETMESRGVNIQKVRLRGIVVLRWGVGGGRSISHAQQAKQVLTR